MKKLLCFLACLYGCSFLNAQPMGDAYKGLCIIIKNRDIQQVVACPTPDLDPKKPGLQRQYSEEELGLIYMQASTGRQHCVTPPLKTPEPDKDDKK